MRRIGVVACVSLVIALAGLPAGVQAQEDDGGLVAEWHFDLGSGSVLKDGFGNENDGVIHGATWVEGTYGKALSFHGVDDYVNVPDLNSLDLTDKITIEVWMKPASTSSYYKGIISKGDAALHHHGPWELVINRVVAE